MPNILIRIILTKVIYPSHRSFDTIDHTANTAAWFRLAGLEFHDDASYDEYLYVFEQSKHLLLPYDSVTDQAWLEGREFHDDDEYIDLVEQSVDYILLRSDDLPKIR